MPVIEVKHLSKSYRVFRKADGFLSSISALFKRKYETVHAVSDVSFEIEPGEIVAFLGPNGAGKTTTLKLLSGLIYPTSGTASVLNHTPWKRENDYRRRFSLVMGQKNQLWWDLPAQDSFRLHKEIYRIPPDVYTRQLDELTSLLEVKKLLGQPVRELSLGERMRMELIAALLHNPEVLFLDEPTIGLDVVSQRKVLNFLQQYQRERKVTILLTSHYMKDVEALCQRAIVINHGQLIYDGEIGSLLESFGNNKIVTLQFANDEIPVHLSNYGEVIEVQPPRVKLKIDRHQISGALSRILTEFNVEDISVHERPLEDVITELFTTTPPLNKYSSDPVSATNSNSSPRSR
jgi:ABC-2 type transport system ATP-binding protein